MQDHILKLQEQVASCQEQIIALQAQEKMLNAEICAAKANLKNAFKPEWLWNVTWESDTEFRVTRRIADCQVEEAKLVGFDDRQIDWHGMNFLVLIDGSLFSNGSGWVVLKEPRGGAFERRIKLEAFELDMFKRGIVPERLMK